MLSLAGGNIFVDGSEYLSCKFLFWGPSEKSKKTVVEYELSIKRLYDKLLSRQVSYYVLWYVWKNRKGRTLTYKPWIPDDTPKLFDTIPDTPPGLKDAGAYVNATSNRGALIAGSVYRNFEHNFDRTSMGKAPEPDDLADGSGSDAVVRMTPGLIAGSEGWGRYDGPGFHPDEVLFHETVHALDDITGENAGAKPGPPGYDNLEEFAACTISNMYISQENLYNPALASLLRSGHGGKYNPKTKAIESKALPTALSVSKGFADKHGDYLVQVAANHRDLVEVYKKMTWVPFNPFLYI